MGVLHNVLFSSYAMAGSLVVSAANDREYIPWNVDMRNLNLTVVFRERRFLGLRIAVYLLPFAFIGFILFLLKFEMLGLSLFIFSFMGFVIGFSIHFSRWRDHP